MNNINHHKIERLRKLARLLDSSIPLPGGYRVGIDGFLGLIPGIGDIIAGLASSYIIIESAKLGATTTTLIRMALNVLLEALIGIIPFFGDIFDFIWKANEKNLLLLEKQLEKTQATSPPKQRIGTTLVIIASLLVAGIIVFALLGLWLVVKIFSAVSGGIGV